ncbi:hypothetical protein ACNHYB_13755 [Isoptericola jiangsuensis]|uniref:hypothetical protein n=1 Tax=Isoptericola jiangsuensis TaxID=548579 RepID=UPI003AB0E955
MQAEPVERTVTTWIAVSFSAFLLGSGLAVGVLTGEWWALLCASGLVVLPLSVRRGAR